MNNLWFSLSGLSDAYRWPIHYPYWPGSVRKTPDIQLPQDVKDRLEQETIAKSAAKKLKREQNKKRDKKK